MPKESSPTQDHQAEKPSRGLMPDDQPDFEASTELYEQKESDSGLVRDFLWLVSEYIYYVDAETIDEHREKIASRLHHVKSNKAALTRALDSSDHFVAVTETIRDLADLNLPPDETLGQELVQFGLEFACDHADLFERMIVENAYSRRHSDIQEVGAAIRALAGLMKSGQQRVFSDRNLSNRLYFSGIDPLLNNADIIEDTLRKELLADPMGAKVEKYAYALEPLFRQLMKPEERCRAAKLTADIATAQCTENLTWSSSIESTIRVILQYVRHPASGKLDLQQPADLFLYEMLLPYGISPDKCHDAWQKSVRRGPRDLFQKYAVDNLRMMGALSEWLSDESKELSSGAVRLLATRFGIYDVARYPLAMLSHQCRAADNTQLPYGLIINPRDDHSGAFYHDKKIWKELHRELTKLEQPILLRAIEVENKRELGRRAVELYRKYGSAKFGIIGGHGTPWSIRFGTREGMDLLHKDDAQGGGMQRGAAMLFDEEATIILNSCLVGTSQGMAQKMSDASDMTFIGSEEATSFKDIHVQMRSGKLHWQVDYRKEGTGRTYRQGQVVTQ